MVRLHYQLNGHEFEQAVGDGEGQGNLTCCSHKQSDTTEQLNNNSTCNGGSEKRKIISLECWSWGIRENVISISP